MTEKLKVIELFSGIGSQHKALDRLGIDFEILGVSEFDEKTHECYELIHGKTKNFGDITKIEELPYCDLLTYSSPCQDFSLAGKRKGLTNADGTLTRSGLLKHVERLLYKYKENNTLPKYLLMENVKNLVVEFHDDFQDWLKELNKIGYNSFYKVLNAKDFGTAQCRERVFVVSIRQDLDEDYVFPTEYKKNNLVLNDYLEQNVSSKYDLEEKYRHNINTSLIEKTMNNMKSGPVDRIYCMGNLRNQAWGCGYNGPSYLCYGLGPTLTCSSSSLYVFYDFKKNENANESIDTGTRNEETFDKEKFNSFLENAINNSKYKDSLPKLAYRLAVDIELLKSWYQSKDLSLPTSAKWTKLKFYLGLKETEYDSYLKDDKDKIIGLFPYVSPKKGQYSYRVRKFTPLEWFKLMTFDEEDFNKLKGYSDDFLYAKAGNSIVVTVLEGVFYNLLINKHKKLKSLF